jgi:plastocyanin
MKTAHACAAVLAVATALSCFSEGADVTAPIDLTECAVPGSAIGDDRVVVFVRGFAFSPDTIRVRRNTTVTWVNCEVADPQSHTTTANGDAWDSGLLAPGESFARRFDTNGTFGYFCRPHPFMRGAVIVE